MKSIFIIFSIALMSVIFSQTSMNICCLHSSFNTEYFCDSSIQVEDNYEEDNLTIDNNTSFHPILMQYLSGTLSPYSISGISRSVWQPPE